MVIKLIVNSTRVNRVKGFAGYKYKRIHTSNIRIHTNIYSTKASFVIQPVIVTFTHGTVELFELRKLRIVYKLLTSNPK